MARYRQRVQRSPDAAPAPGIPVRVLRASDNATLGLAATDDDGVVDWRANGSPGPVAFLIADQPGGPKVWASHDAMAVGPLSLPEVPYALRALGDGVVRGVLGELAVSAGSGQSLAVATGAALVAGLPVVQTTVAALPYALPAASTRRDRVVVRVNAETGEARIAVLAGTEGGGVPELTQTETTRELALATVTVPVAAPVTIADERGYSGEAATVSGVAHAERVETTSAGGEALDGLAVTLLLPRAGVYDVTADLSARQSETASRVIWREQRRFGSAGAGSGQLDNPSQLAIAADGSVWVADSLNARMQHFTALGAVLGSITGFTRPALGVTIDGSGNIYAASVGANNLVRKHDASGAVLGTLSGASSSSVRHIATAGSRVWWTTGNTIKRGTTKAGSGTIATFGSTGTGNGQFQTPYGICTDDTHVWVVDSGNNRVQKLLASNGSYVAQFGRAGSGDGEFSGPFGCALDGDGNLWVADTGNNRLQRFSGDGEFQTQVAIPAPKGVAVAPDGSVWATSGSAVVRLVSAITTGGYGAVAIEIGGGLSPYSGIGARDGALGMTEVAEASGPGSVLVRVFGKATSETLTLAGVTLTARAAPRR